MLCRLFACSTVLYLVRFCKIGCLLCTGARGRVGRNCVGWNARLEKHRWHFVNEPRRNLDDARDCAMMCEDLRLEQPLWKLSCKCLKKVAWCWMPRRAPCGLQLATENLPRLETTRRQVHVEPPREPLLLGAHCRSHSHSECRRASSSLINNILKRQLKMQPHPA